MIPYLGTVCQGPCVQDYMFVSESRFTTMVIRILRFESMNLEVIILRCILWIAAFYPFIHVLGGMLSKMDVFILSFRRNITFKKLTENCLELFDLSVQRICLFPIILQLQQNGQQSAFYKTMKVLSSHHC